MLPRYWVEHPKSAVKNTDIIQEFQSIVPAPLTELQAPPTKSFAVPQEDLTLLNQHLQEFDQERYGMSFAELQALVHDSDTQITFTNQYGIPLREYLTRVLNGENMGESLVDGKFKPLFTSENNVQEE